MPRSFHDRNEQLVEVSYPGRTEILFYGAAGNLLKDDRASYTYDAFNRNTKVVTFAGNIQINRYDAEELRHEMEENGRLV